MNKRTRRLTLGRESLRRLDLATGGDTAPATRSCAGTCDCPLLTYDSMCITCTCPPILE